MKVALAADHGGYKLKDKLIEHLNSKGIETVDFGTNSDSSCYYPDYADKVCHAITSGECELGILVCSTGIGMSIAANKHPGIRAACCSDLLSVSLTRSHNDSNVLCLGAFIVAERFACEMADIFVSTPFSGEERHVRRVSKLIELDKYLDKSK